MKSLKAKYVVILSLTLVLLCSFFAVLMVNFIPVKADVETVKEQLVAEADEKFANSLDVADASNLNIGWYRSDQITDKNVYFTVKTANAITVNALAWADPLHSVAWVGASTNGLYGKNQDFSVKFITNITSAGISVIVDNFSVIINQTSIVVGYNDTELNGDGSIANRTTYSNPSTASITGNGWVVDAAYNKNFAGLQLVNVHIETVSGITKFFVKVGQESLLTATDHARIYFDTPVISHNDTTSANVIMSANLMPTIAQGTVRCIEGQNSGLMFESSLDKGAIEKSISFQGSFWSLFSNVSFGTLLIPADYLTSTTTVADLVAQGKVLNIAASGFYPRVSTETLNKFWATMTDVKNGNLCRKFVATSYVTLTYSSATYTVYSFMTEGISLYQAAKDVLNNDSSSAYAKEVCKEYVDSVVEVDAEGICCNTVNDYTAPYSVTVVENVYTINSTVAIKSVIIDGKIYKGSALNLSNENLTSTITVE